MGSPEERLASLRAWIQEELGTDVDFEVNVDTVRELESLRSAQDRQVAADELVAADFRSAASSHQQAAARLLRVLEGVGMLAFIENDPFCARLAEAATVLNASEPSAAALALRIVEEESLAMASRERRVAAEARRSEVQARLGDDMHVLRGLEKLRDEAIQSLAQHNKERRPLMETSLNVMTQKAEEYKHSIEEARRELVRIGFDPENMDHSHLHKRGELLRARMQDVARRRAELEQFGELPLNMEAARLRVVEIEREVARVEDQLRAGVQDAGLDFVDDRW